MICWKIRIFAYWTTPQWAVETNRHPLWFAEKFVSLLIEQHQNIASERPASGCDLLKNSYLCLLNNTLSGIIQTWNWVVICWKIRIFAYWTTPNEHYFYYFVQLWFAEKFVSLLIEQHLAWWAGSRERCCDLLKNSYLCLLNNTHKRRHVREDWVVICWKIRIFAYWTTPDYVEVAQYESVVSNDRNGKNPMLEGRDLNKREVSSFLLIYLHALSFSMKRRNWV